MSTEIEQVTLAVAAINKVEAGLNALRVSYEGVLFEVTTAAGMEAAKAARAEIREPRYEVERIRKAAKAPILALGKKLDSEAARITAELEKIEGPIDAQIKAEEARKETEKQARIEAELKRVAALQERLAELRGNPSLTPMSGSMLISRHIVDLEAIPVDDTFEEYRAQAEDAKVAGLARLNALLAGAVAHEAEQAKLKAEREELAKLRADQAERDRIAREAQAKIDADAKAERDRLETIAKAERDAEAKRLREERAENDRIAREQREANEAEQKRLASERAALEAAQAASRKAAEPKPEPAYSMPRIVERPSVAQLVALISSHYKVSESMARLWLRTAKVELEQAA